MFLPTLVPDYVACILFLSLAAMTTCALVALALLPRFGDEPASSGGGAARARLSSSFRLTALLALVALFLFQAGNIALPAFILSLGDHFALDRNFIGPPLGWATWLGPPRAGPGSWKGRS